MVDESFLFSIIVFIFCNVLSLYTQIFEYIASIVVENL